LHGPGGSLGALRQAEIGDHSANGAIRPFSQDDVVAFEIAMDHLIAVGLGQALAELPRDHPHFSLGRGSAMEPFRERLAVKELHRYEINFPAARRSRMDFKDFADVGMTDFAGVADFRRQPPAKAGLGALDSDPPVELLVRSFVNEAHPPLCHLSYDPEAAVENLSRLEGLF
jgi:hypothetical protein